MEYAYGIFFILLCFIVFYKLSTNAEDKEDLSFNDLVLRHNNKIENSKQSDKETITKLVSYIVEDIRDNKVKPLISINDNTRHSLESFIDRGNVGFYTYFRGVTIPKYYIRKVKNDTKIITFNEGEQIVTFLNIHYSQFMKEVIDKLKKDNVCK